MRRLTIIPVLVMIISSALLAFGGELSPRAAEYLERLERFEIERVNSLKAELKEKRVQVSGLLEQQMKALTQKGDLEGALAVKSEIDALTGEVDLMAIGTTAEAEETTQEAPEDSLITKLKKFESEKVEQLKSELREKRIRVGDILQTELETLTKEGDLDGALAVKTDIERLRGEIELEPTIAGPAPTRQQREELPEEEAKKALKEFLIGRTMLFSNEGYLFEYHFEPEGKMRRIRNKEGEGVTEVKSSEWKVVGANVADVVHSDGAVEKFTFTSDTEAKKEFFRGETLRSTFTAKLKD